MGRNLILLLIFLCGCSGQRAYHGDADPNTLARFTGFDNPCYGRMIITEFDGKYSGERLEAPAGKHKMVLNYWSEPFWPDPEPGLSPLALCVIASKHTAEFASKPLLRYTFEVKAHPETGHHLTVWESNNPREIDSHQISAVVDDLAQKRVCTLSSYYDECFDFGGD